MALGINPRPLGSTHQDHDGVEGGIGREPAHRVEVGDGPEGKGDCAGEHGDLKRGEEEGREREGSEERRERGPGLQKRPGATQKLSQNSGRTPRRPL